LYLFWQKFIRFSVLCKHLCNSAVKNGLSARSLQVHLSARWTEENISKSTIYLIIKDCENGLPCVVKPNIKEPRVADIKTMWERRHGFRVLRILKKKLCHLQKTNQSS
jgi:hypothetical protein